MCKTFLGNPRNQFYKETKVHWITRIAACATYIQMSRWRDEKIELDLPWIYLIIKTQKDLYKWKD